MEWLRIDSGLPDHPKVLRLADALGVRTDAALALIVRLFCWTAKVSETGELRGLSERSVCEAARLSGSPSKVIDALVSVGVLERTRDGFRVHDWSDIQSPMVAARDRMREWRNKKRERSVTGDVTGDVTRASNRPTDRPTDSITPLPPAHAGGRPRSMSIPELEAEIDAIRHRAGPDAVMGADRKRLDDLRSELGRRTAAPAASGGEA